MTTWLESTNVHQNGEPVTRKIKIPEMGEEIWFTDNAYAEVSDDVGDILANNIDSISKLSSAPSSPGTYYGDANSNTTVQINISDGVFDAVTAESMDVDGVGIAPDVTESEPGVPATETKSATTPFDETVETYETATRGLEMGARWLGPSLHREHNPSYTTTATSYEEIARIPVPPVDYPPGVAPIIRMSVVASSDTSGEGGAVRATFFHSTFSSGPTNDAEIVRGVVNNNIGTSSHMFHKEVALTRETNEMNSESGTSMHHRFPAIVIEAKSSVGTATFSIEHLDFQLIYEVA